MRVDGWQPPLGWSSRMQNSASQHRCQDKLGTVRKGLTVEDLGDLVDLPLLAVLATYWADGTALLSPVWHEYRDGGFHVCTSGADVKARHLRRDPRAA